MQETVSELESGGGMTTTAAMNLPTTRVLTVSSDVSDSLLRAILCGTSEGHRVLVESADERLRVERILAGLCKAGVMVIVRV